jgi:hypothetical protein
VLSTVQAIGWSDASGLSIHATREGLFRQVVDVAGPLLRGEIHWRFARNNDAHRLIDELLEDAAPVFVAHCDQVRAALAENGGWVVVAEAPVEIEGDDA